MCLLDTAEAAAELARAAGKTDLYRMLLELMGQVTQLAQENFALKQQLSDVQEQLRLSEAAVCAGACPAEKQSAKSSYPGTTPVTFARLDWDVRMIGFPRQLSDQAARHRVCPSCKQPL